MKPIEWDPIKNTWLQNERDISFEAIIVTIEDGKLLDIITNPNKNHATQEALVVDLDGYLVLVPFIETEEKLFLKTAYKSRKLTRHYKRRKPL